MPDFALDIFVWTKILLIFVSFSSLVLISVLVLVSLTKIIFFCYFRYRCRHRRQKNIG